VIVACNYILYKISSMVGMIILRFFYLILYAIQNIDNSTTNLVESIIAIVLEMIMSMNLSLTHQK